MNEQKLYKIACDTSQPLPALRGAMGLLNINILELVPSGDEMRYVVEYQRQDGKWNKTVVAPANTSTATALATISAAVRQAREFQAKAVSGE